MAPAIKAAWARTVSSPGVTAARITAGYRAKPAQAWG